MLLKSPQVARFQLFRTQQLGEAIEASDFESAIALVPNYAELNGSVKGRCNKTIDDCAKTLVSNYAELNGSVKAIEVSAYTAVSLTFPTIPNSTAR